MKIIVGLGNPGQEYEGTRHNAGFVFAGTLARDPDIAPVDRECKFEYNKKSNALILKTVTKGEDIILVKPQTYMNLSGESVRSLLRFYQAEPTDLIIVSDDLDLPLGQVRIRHEGASGGQKGLQNIIDNLGGQEFTRIRIGIGAIKGNIGEMDHIEPRQDAAQYVLSQFSEREIEIFERAIAEAINYIKPYLGSNNDLIPAHTLKVI